MDVFTKLFGEFRWQPLSERDEPHLAEVQEPGVPVGMSNASMNRLTLAQRCRDGLGRAMLR